MKMLVTPGWCFSILLLDDSPFVSGIGGTPFTGMGLDQGQVASGTAFAEQAQQIHIGPWRRIRVLCWICYPDCLVPLEAADSTLLT